MLRSIMCSPFNCNEIEIPLFPHNLLKNAKISILNVTKWTICITWMNVGWLPNHGTRACASRHLSHVCRFEHSELSWNKLNKITIRTRGVCYCWCIKSIYRQFLIKLWSFAFHMSKYSEICKWSDYGDMKSKEYLECLVFLVICS